MPGGHFVPYKTRKFKQAEPPKNTLEAFFWHIILGFDEIQTWSAGIVCLHVKHIEWINRATVRNISVCLSLSKLEQSLMDTRYSTVALAKI